MKVLFNVGTVRPDMRQFRQNAIELFPHDELCVEINLDATREPFAKGQDPTPFVISLETLKGLTDRFDLLFAGVSNEPEGDEGWQDDPEDEADSWGEVDADADEVETVIEDEW